MKTLFTICVSLTIFAGTAQTYTFSSFTGGYSDLFGSTSLNDGMTWDDPYFTVPIGFSFDYFGDPIDELSFDGLGGLLVSGDCGVDPYYSYLLPYGSDIIDRGYDLGSSLSNLSHKTEGVVGNRICKIEWNNVGFFDGEVGPDNIYVDYLNFQLWLYESSGAIEMRFGPKSISNPTLDFYGESGAFVTMIHAIDCSTDEIYGHQLILDGNATAPILQDNTFNLDDTIVYLNGVIPPFTVYRFVPAATTDVSELDNISPFMIIPNPAEDEISIQLNSSTDIENVTIYSMNGVEVINADVNEIVNISHLLSGMYLAKAVDSSGKVFVEKFTKR